MMKGSLGKLLGILIVLRMIPASKNHVETETERKVQTKEEIQSRCDEGKRQ